MEKTGHVKKKPLTEEQRSALLAKYQTLLQKDGQLASQIEKTSPENPALEELVRKNPNRLIGGCG